MKVAFTTSGNDLNAPLDSRFGRAPKFLVYDLDSETFEVVDNQQNLNAAQGAGMQPAETVARLKATVRNRPSSGRV
jgi:predicted Fe-Mo cluster-binding NifX family protein